MVAYKNILYCTDYSEDADLAFIHAVQFAQRYESKLHVLHILDTIHRYTPYETSEPVEDENKGWIASPELVEKITTKVRERYQPRLGGLSDVTWTVIPGVPFVEILRFARENGVDLIVMGSAGESEQDQTSFLSTVANVSRRAPCHVMAIRNPRSGTLCRPERSPQDGEKNYCR